MAQPEGTKQISMYVPRDLLDNVDASVRDIYDGNLRKRTDWMIDAMREKLGGERDTRLVALAAAFESMNDDGREWLYLAAAMAANNERFVR